MIRLAVFVSTFGYVGYAPLAPGTAGSAAGLAVFGVLRLLGLGPIAEVSLIALLFVAGVWSGTLAERHFGKTDPAPGVIDEVVGMLITLFLLPASPVVLLGGFILFRILDIVKPFPARRVEALPGGLGMMADDAVAGVYAHLLLRGLLLAMPASGV
jgi:phosphatidylglycerophosphatase A